jgi:hypothetical protein
MIAHDKCLMTDRNPLFTSRTLAIIHDLTVHDNLEKFSSEVVGIGMQSSTREVGHAAQVKGGDKVGCHSDLWISAQSPLLAKEARSGAPRLSASKSTRSLGADTVISSAMMVFYCATLIRELDPGIQRSKIDERWIPRPSSSPPL